MKFKCGHAEGQYSQAHAVIFGDGLMQGQELDYRTLVGPFQISIFCDSVKLWQKIMFTKPII